MSLDDALIGPHLQTFFAEHLCHHRRVSAQTLASMRDTFRLLLQFLRKTAGIEPSALRVADLDAPVVLAFLDYLEQQRSNSVRSRNIRLSAIRSFFRWVALREPQAVAIVSRVLAIPVKREDKKLIGYLTREEMEALIAAPDRRHWIGRRDHALLLTLYNSGARVSEITGLERDQVCFGDKTYLQLKGKGRKERSVPLWSHTARTLKAWFAESSDVHNTNIAFPSCRGRALSRQSVTYLMQKAAQQAAVDCPSLATRKLSPHLVRHGTAMHLLQAGVDVAVIALWLGHEHVDTTHVYLQTDLKIKEQALEKLDPVKEQGSNRFRADDPLLAFLASL
jgi:site-specific recombinase XerD